MNSDKNFKTFLLAAGDMLFFYAALISAVFLRYGAGGWLKTLEGHFLPFALIFALWLTVFAAFGFYEPRLMKNNRYFLYLLLRSMFINLAVAALLFYLLPLGIEPRRNLALITAFSVLFIFGWRFAFNFFILRTGRNRVLFFGVNKEVEFLADYLIKNPQLGYQPAAFVLSEKNGSPAEPSLPLFYFYSEQDLPRIIKDLKIDLVAALREIKENKTFVSLLFRALPLGASVKDFASFYEMIMGKIPLSLIGETWFLENLATFKRNSYEFFKRLLDAAAALTLGAPALLSLPLIAAAIKLDSSGPVFFRQKRIGRNGEEFWLVKYRSMIEGADKINGCKGEKTDKRHTRVGAFLRKSYIDEIPQIINILKGEMSFVGPRPERPEYVSELKEKVPFYEMRLLVQPGLTGWAQINMENDASVEDAPEKMQYDLYYIKNRNFTLDLLIIIRTIFTVLRRQGR